MTFFNTQEGKDIGYRLQFETDDKEKFIYMQEKARNCIDNIFKDDTVRHGHWNLSADIADGDDGDRWVHVNAKCSRCGSGWRDYTAVITDYFDSSDYPLTDELIWNRKEKSLKLARRTLKECSLYCEKCGAKMDEEEEE